MDGDDTASVSKVESPDHICEHEEVFDVASWKLTERKLGDWRSSEVHGSRETGHQYRGASGKEDLAEHDEIAAHGNMPWANDQNPVLQTQELGDDLLHDCSRRWHRKKCRNQKLVVAQHCRVESLARR